MMDLYGVGDHGGGPTRAMLDEGDHWMEPDKIVPKMQFGLAQPFFTHVEKKIAADSPAWDYKSIAKGYTYPDARRRQDRHPHLERRDVPRVPSRRLHHPGQPQAQHARQRRVDAERREVCLAGVARRRLLSQRRGSPTPGRRSPSTSSTTSPPAPASASSIRTRRRTTTRCTGRRTRSRPRRCTRFRLRSTRAPAAASPCSSSTRWHGSAPASLTVDVQLPEASANGVSVLDAHEPRAAFEGAVERREDEQLQAAGRSEGRSFDGLRGAARRPRQTGRSPATSRPAERRSRMPRCASSSIRRPAASPASSTRSRTSRRWPRAPAATSCRPSTTRRSNTTPGTSIPARSTTTRRSTRSTPSKLVEKGPMRATIRVTRTWQSSKFVQDITLYAGADTVDRRQRYRLARDPRPAEGRIPARRIRAEGDVRDSLRHHRARHHTQQQLGEGTVRGSGASAGPISATRSTASA